MDRSAILELAKKHDLDLEVVDGALHLRLVDVRHHEPGAGAVDDAGAVIEADNLLAGLLELFGVDPNTYFPGAEVYRGFQA